MKLIITLATAILVTAIANCQTTFDVFVHKGQTVGAIDFPLKTIFHKGNVSLTFDNLEGVNVNTPQAVFGFAFPVIYDAKKGWKFGAGLGFDEPFQNISAQDFNLKNLKNLAGLNLYFQAPFTLGSFFAPSVKIANMESHAL